MSVKINEPNMIISSQNSQALLVLVSNISMPIMQATPAITNRLKGITTAIHTIDSKADRPAAM